MIQLYLTPSLTGVAKTIPPKGMHEKAPSCRSLLRMRTGDT
jgi:hypothetical protein